LYRRYDGRAEFFVVYIQEAHPVDAWQTSSNVRDRVLFADPTSFGERAHVAGLCVRNLKIDIPALVDGTDNATERAYTGWPDRLYVIDREGRVAYKSAPGPFGFKPHEMAATLERVAASGHTAGPRAGSAP
jgi:type I thyroxine 5'-deiodinase